MKSQITLLSVSGTLQKSLYLFKTRLLNQVPCLEEMLTSQNNRQHQMTGHFLRLSSKPSPTPTACAQQILLCHKSVQS